MKKNNNKSVWLEKYVTARQAVCHAWTQYLCLMSVKISCAMGHLWKKKKAMKCDLKLI